MMAQSAAVRNAGPFTSLGPDGKRLNRGKYRRESLQAFFLWIEKRNLPRTEDSLIEWDRTQNGKKLLDWDTKKNIRRGLWVQASLILTSYTRVRDARTGISMPTQLKEGGVMVPIEEIEPEDMASILQSWQFLVRQKIIRIASMEKGNFAIAKRATLDAVADAQKELRKKR
jgi:hypothetical protein